MNENVKNIYYLIDSRYFIRRNFHETNFRECKIREISRNKLSRTKKVFENSGRFLGINLKNQPSILLDKFSQITILNISQRKAKNGQIRERFSE